MAKILVIDDNLTYVELLRDCLDSLEHEIVALDICEQASEVAEGYDPDLVILDIEMPTNGRTILQELKRRRPGRPVIVYSAYGGYRNDPDFSIADAFVVKSTDLRELLKHARRITRTSTLCWTFRSLDA